MDKPELTKDTESLSYPPLQPWSYMGCEIDTVSFNYFFVLKAFLIELAWQRFLDCCRLVVHCMPIWLTEVSIFEIMEYASDYNRAFFI
jgi:hypothetical protein